jgi:GNAT superfamily N-acetyltransferase
MVTFRNQCDILGFGEDYFKIRSFLIDLEKPNWHFGRWDWMVTHLWLDTSGLPRIGVWEDEGKIVALATYDTELGGSYFNVASGYEFLQQPMLEYSSLAFAKEGRYRALLGDDHKEFQATAGALGYGPTSDQEHDAVFAIEGSEIPVSLPAGFRLQSLEQNCDVYRYGKVLWRGFNHEADGEGAYRPSEDKLARLEAELRRPNVNLDLKVAVVAANGEFVSYCGMWYEPGNDSCLVEPVATDPDYRGLGLGKAAVLEGIRRCQSLGAKKALVGSSQPFYSSIGFHPLATSTWWQAKTTLP